MSDFTARDFEDMIENSVIKIEGAYTVVDSLYGFYQTLWNDVSSIETPMGTVTSVSEATNSSGEDSESRTLVFTVDGRFFRKTGYYDSWESADWDGELVEVEPKQVYTTVYEEIVK